MKNVASATLLPCLPGVEVTFIASTNTSIELQLTTTASNVACPLCGQVARRVHSRYRRTLADLPWNRVAVRILLHPRKLFCDNLQCKRRIFTEPLPQLVAPYARKTLQLQEALYFIGYALGGKAGARVAAELELTASADTLLRRVRQVATQRQNPANTGLRVVGIDDFAFRKGHRYGTILVDLESRRLVDLLPDRSSESVSAWLKRHPGVEIVSRDRAVVYAEGATAGAPQAKQVADRWHLLRNLGEAMERLTAQHSPLFRQVAQSSQAKANASAPSAPSLATQAIPGTPETPDDISKVSGVEQRRLDRSARREAVYHQVKALREQGASLEFIAGQTGISTRTIQRFVGAEQFPARARRRPQSCLTDAYKSYLQERVVSGYTNVAQLYREIKAKGYSGSYSCVYARVSRIVDRTTSGVQRVRSPDTGTREIPPSRVVAWWLQGHLTTSKPEIAEQQKAFLDTVFEQAPALKEASDLAQGFIALVKGRCPDDFALWLERAIKSDCSEVRSFAQGIQQDLTAVTNAISLSWSNGQTEGQVNRLKMVKRQMYGRAAFDLLRARVMPVPPRMAA